MRGAPVAPVELPALRMKAAQIPNLLTTLRLLLVPWILLALAQPAYRLAALLLAVAALSDVLDGHLARRYGWQTRIGGLLDPLADKLLANALFVGLWWAGTLPGWLPLLVLARDLLIVGGAAAYHWRVAPLVAEPTWIGKASTVAQLVFLWLAILDLAFDRTSSPWWPHGVGVVVVLTVASGIDYAWRWSRRARARSNHRE